MKQIKIDPEFAKFIPPMRESERVALESSIVAGNGPTDPLIVWRERGTLLDGHNRLDICKRLRLPYRVEFVSLASVAEARQWIHTRAVAKRNLTQDQIIMLGVMHGLTDPAHRGLLAVRKAQEIHAADPNLVAGVWAGTMSITIAYNDLMRSRGTVNRRRPAPNGGAVIAAACDVVDGKPGAAGRLRTAVMAYRASAEPVK